MSPHHCRGFTDSRGSSGEFTVLPAMTAAAPVTGRIATHPGKSTEGPSSNDTPAINARPAAVSNAADAGRSDAFSRGMAMDNRPPQPNSQARVWGPKNAHDGTRGVRMTEAASEVPVT